MDIQTTDHFWKCEEGQEHTSVFSILDGIDQRSDTGLDRYSEYLSAYLDRDLSGFSTTLQNWSGYFGGPKGINLNVTKSCIDTVLAKIVPHRVRPMFLTTEGKFEDRQKAKLLERWVEGLFYREELYSEILPAVFLDAAIFGTGCLHIYEDDDGEVRLERVWIGEIVVDETAAVTGKPRVLFRRKRVNREVLLAEYGDQPTYGPGDQTLGDAIKEVPPEARWKEDTNPIGDDVIMNAQAWHLPSGKDAGDGRYACCVRSATLDTYEYTERDFPFRFFRWSRSPLGFTGIGLAEELQGIQAEIRDLAQRIQEAMHLTATVRTWVPVGSKVSEGAITNRIGDVNYYTGQRPPHTETPASMNSQVFDHLWRLEQEAYAITGVSRMSASGVKPAGVESGVALRTLVDVETQRFAMLASDWQDFVLSVAKGSITMARYVYKDGKRGRVVWASRNNLTQVINWKDVDLHEDAFIMRAHPSSLLPSTPAGKLSYVSDLMQMGLLTDPAEARQLLNHPDLDRYFNLANAQRETAQWVIEEALYHDRYIPPEPEMGLEQAIPMAQSYFLIAMREGAPDDVLQRLSKWLREADRIVEDGKKELAKRMPQMPPGPAGPGGPMPEAMGMVEPAAMDPAMAAANAVSSLPPEAL